MWLGGTGWCYCLRMTPEQEALSKAVDRLRKRTKGKTKLANILLATGLFFLFALVFLIRFHEEAFGGFSEEFIERLVESPETLGKALWLTHTTSVAQARSHHTLVWLSGAVGAMIGAGIVLRFKGTSDVLVNILDRIEALEAKRND